MLDGLLLGEDCWQWHGARSMTDSRRLWGIMQHASPLAVDLALRVPMQARYSCTVHHATHHTIHHTIYHTIHHGNPPHDTGALRGLPRRGGVAASLVGPCGGQRRRRPACVGDPAA